MSNSIRIRTTPNGNDNYVKVKLDQNFDFIEILSLKISQDKVYQKFSSDYGVIVGRVVVNNGFGVPNAKVSVFIPLSDEDAANTEIAGLYPYTSVTDKDSDGVRYNLLPKESDSKDYCYTPVGTFSAKREVLDNEVLTQIYKKYYKFTSTTNAGGDFMIFGVPIGTYTVHVDADISNIGIISQRPYDLIDQGVSDKLFNSPTKFKDSKNLNSLVQVKTADVGVNVQPFWGDLDVSEIGISRVDIDLNYTVRPAAIFVGSIFGDSGKNSVNKNCRPRKNMGKICETATGGGSVEMIRKTFDGNIENYSVDGGRVIDDNGAWAYQIPLNLDYMVTDEFGNLILSNDENKGIPTRSRVRFRIGLDEQGDLGRLRTRAKYLVPHNPTTFADRDFSFDNTTKDSSFTDIYWNKIYSIKNFIARIQNDGSVDNRSILGLKDLDNCTGDKTPFPYNKIDTNINPLFSIICIILTIIGSLIYFLNIILCAIRDIHFLRIRPFKHVVKPITLSCPSEPPLNFAPGCRGAALEPFVDCVSSLIAEDLGLFELDFYNDWVNGTLYAYSLKYKKKKKGKERFCEYDCAGFPNTVHDNNCNTKLMLDSCVGSDGGKGNASISIIDGFISDYNGTLYYSPIIHNGTYKMYATDVINLGAVLDCDWQGMPTLHQYLTPSTFKIPPVINEVDSEEIVCGMINLNETTSSNGVFFSINCAGVNVSEKNCNNIRKICELGSDIPSNVLTGVTDCNVSLDEIYDSSDPIDVINSINRYVRNMFYGLNINGSSGSTFSLPSDIDIVSNGTSFNINNGTVSQVNGLAYDNFRNYFPVNAAYRQPLGNSFFFYFGLLPGKTAIDKMNSKYFTTCQQSFVDDYIINTSVVNTTTDTSSDGQITFDFIGGTPVYTYTWVGTNFIYGPVTSVGGNTISGLIKGDYIITAVDALGNIVTKKVSVGGPQMLSCFVKLIQTSSTPTANDGKVMVTSIFGGLAPYNLTQIKPDASSTTIPVSQGDIISSVPIGLNSFTITDSSTPQQNCTSTIQMVGPSPLGVVLSGTSSGCGIDGTGFLEVIISGGTPPYTIMTTGPMGYTGNTIIQDGLSAGTYTTIVTDVATQSYNGSVSLIVGTIPVATVSTVSVIGNTGYTFTHTVVAIGGIPPYDGVGNFNDNNASYTTSVIDSTGCESDQVTG
jgi:hypothetical protein